MKKIFKIQLTIFCLLLFSCSSESNKSKELEDKPIVTFQDSLSYTMGVNIGQNLPETEINRDLLIEGLNDSWNNEEPRINTQTRNEVLKSYNIRNSERNLSRSLSEKSKKLSKENKIAGQEFLDKNKNNEGIKFISNTQIQYKVVQEGLGQIPDFDDVVVVHYNGFLIDGTKFDSSYDRGEPATFALNRVIQGWQQTLQEMPVGSKWKVYIPENLGYGITGVIKDAKNEEYVIPPSSTLIFDIELINIVD
jgi:FKBP-type peptidyl-prolyl cis-trans isomerase